MEKAKAETVEDVMKDEKKKKVFYKWMDSSQVKMYGKKVGNKWVKGIEDFIPNEQYKTDEYVMGLFRILRRSGSYIAVVESSMLYLQHPAFLKR